MPESIECKHKRFIVLFFSSGKSMGQTQKRHRVSAMNTIRLWLGGGDNRTAILTTEETFE